MKEENKLEERPYFKCFKCGREYTFDSYIYEAVKASIESKIARCKCGRKFFGENRHVKKDYLKIKELGLKLYLSTVFLGMNHSFGDDEPLWYETMVFIEEHKDNANWDCFLQERYTTKEEAKAGHKRVKAMIKERKFIVKELIEEEGSKIYRIIEFVEDHEVEFITLLGHFDVADVIYKGRGVK